MTNLPTGIGILVVVAVAPVKEAVRVQDRDDA
jgi:hypothetical protein